MRLSRIIAGPHIKLTYKLTDILEELLGGEVWFRITVGDDVATKYTSKIRFTLLSDSVHIGGRFVAMMWALSDEYENISYSMDNVSIVERRLNL